MVEVYTPPTQPDPAWNAPSPAVSEMKRNLWWTIAAIGIGLLLLAYVVAFFDGLEGRDVGAAHFFALLGRIGIVVGLTLSALLQGTLHWGVRTALILGASFIAVGGAPGWFA